MYGQRAASFMISTTTSFRPLVITIMGAGRGAIVANGDDSGFFGEHSADMLFYAMRTAGQVNGQFHENIIEFRAFHFIVD
jgi:hypothetical protein